VELEGDLMIPDGARGLVVFAHGSGSSRTSPRNRHVAEVLQEGGLATLLMDLLTAEEEEEERYTRHLRFDIAVLAQRLVAVIDWSAQQEDTKDLPLGLFGASTGAAAALVAAAQSPERVRAVVSRGGRPDLAGVSLPSVQAATLLIVGGADTEVIELNREAREQMQAESTLEIIPGAGHLFEEPGALDQVAALARDWFSSHLGA
jgi:pimeloyl-ACP methyl ester carboxylesterase